MAEKRLKAVTMKGRALDLHEERRGHRDERIHEAREDARPNEPEPRHEEERKQDRCRERAQVIECEGAGDEIAEALAVATKDLHEQRELEPHQHADTDKNPLQDFSHGESRSWGTRRRR